MRSAAPSVAEHSFANRSMDGPKITKGDKSMNDLNRVLLRKGARALTGEEVEYVGGGIRTATPCTAPTKANANLDGDTFMSECGADV